MQPQPLREIQHVFKPNRTPQTRAAVAVGGAQDIDVGKKKPGGGGLAGGTGGGGGGGAGGGGGGGGGVGGALQMQAQMQGGDLYYLRVVQDLSSGSCAGGEGGGSGGARGGTAAEGEDRKETAASEGDVDIESRQVSLKREHGWNERILEKGRDVTPGRAKLILLIVRSNRYRRRTLLPRFHQQQGILCSSGTCPNRHASEIVPSRLV